MDDTCNSATCKLHDLLGGSPSDCPNYIETWWKPIEGTPKLVKDCAPKRTLIMVQELYNQQIRMQAAQEEQRNANINLAGVLVDLARGNGMEISIRDERKLIGG